MQLVSEFLRILYKSGHWTDYWFITMVYTIVTFIPTYFLGGVNSGDNATWYIRAYLVATILTKFPNYFYSVWTNWMSIKIEETFNAEAYQTYESLSFQDRCKEPATGFRTKVREACWALAAFGDWGVPTLVGLVSDVIGTVYVFFREGLMMPLFAIVIGNIMLYWFVTREYQHEFTLLKRDSREKNIMTRSIIECKLPMLEAGSIPSKSLIDLENGMRKRSLEFRRLWSLVSCITRLSNDLPLVTFCFMEDDPLYLLMIIKVFTSFTGSLQGVMGFFNQFTSYQSNLETYMKVWDDVKFKKKAELLSMPQSLQVERIDVNRNNRFFLKLNQKLNELRINQGDRILIRGQSGCGKSTLIQSLLGKIEGVKLSDTMKKPENFYHQVAEFYQNIKEKMPTSKISIRQLFDDEEDDSIISECLETANCLQWAKNIPPKEAKPPKSITTFADVVKKLWEYCFGVEDQKPKVKDKIKDNKDNTLKDYNPFDVPISENHSGGEKTRLALATRIYQVKRTGSKWLVLDEPEQGSDPEVAYGILENILSELPDTTIIVVSHLEFIETKFQWNQKLMVTKENKKDKTSLSTVTKY